MSREGLYCTQILLHCLVQSEAQVIDITSLSRDECVRDAVVCAGLDDATRALHLSHASQVCLDRTQREMRGESSLCLVTTRVISRAPVKKKRELRSHFSPDILHECARDSKCKCSAGARYDDQYKKRPPDESESLIALRAFSGAPSAA